MLVAALDVIANEEDVAVVAEFAVSVVCANEADVGVNVMLVAALAVVENDADVILPNTFCATRV